MTQSLAMLSELLRVVDPALYRHFEAGAYAAGRDGTWRDLR
jgi:hypothetical protein